MKEKSCIEEIYTVRIPVSGCAETRKRFREAVKERIDEMCLDTWIIGTSGYVTVKTGKVKILKIQEVN